MSGKNAVVRRCVECDGELIHHTGSSNWECPNPECPVSYVTLKRDGGFNSFKVDRIVYVAAL